MLFWLVVLSIVVCLGLAVYLEKRFCDYSGPFLVIAIIGLFKRCSNCKYVKGE